LVNKPLVLFLEHEGFSEQAKAKLSEHFDVAYSNITDLGDFKGKAHVYGLFVRLKSRIDSTVFDHFPHLKFIISPTTGHDHLDLDAMRNRGIHMVSLKGEAEFLASVTATAELTWGLILSLTRRIPQALNHVAAGGWERDLFRGIDLSGRTLGIVGYGRLGQIIEKYAHAFRMKMLINDIEPRDPKYGRLVPLNRLLSESDIVTVHVDVNPTSVNMFGESEFRRMKPSALFINTSRGELVDEDALVRALRERRLAAAAIDVIREEQSGRSDSALLRARIELQGQLLVTPHIGGASWDSMAKTENFIVEKLLRLARDDSAD
jgi:D-3-phosphoglycerate dehydrogenase